MDEFALIRQFFDRSVGDVSVLIGVGDDGAVLSTDAGRKIVTVIDTLVEEVHFPSSLAAADIGFRSVAVNLSDMAAMGARPRWMTLALTLDRADERWLQQFADGLYDAAGEYGVSLVGGDTTKGGQKVITVSVIGDVDDGKALTRSGAQVDDNLYVSGTPGDAATGLSLLQENDAGSQEKRYLAARFARPAARVDLGQSLAGIASGAIDVSDGLYSDLARLLASSNVGGTLELDAIPLSAQLISVAGDESALQSALSGGDDYELCFAAPPAHSARIQKLSAELGVPITRIGCVISGSGLDCTRGDSPVAYSDAGFTHF